MSLFFQGRSDRCSTFDNDPLCGTEEEYFTIKAIEVWAFVLWTRAEFCVNTPLVWLLFVLVGMITWPYQPQYGSLVAYFSWLNVVGPNWKLLPHTPFWVAKEKEAAGFQNYYFTPCFFEASLLKRSDLLRLFWGQKGKKERQEKNSNCSCDTTGLIPIVANFFVCIYIISLIYRYCHTAFTLSTQLLPHCLLCIFSTLNTVGRGSISQPRPLITLYYSMLMLIQ